MSRPGAVALDEREDGVVGDDELVVGAHGDGLAVGGGRERGAHGGCGVPLPGGSLQGSPAGSHAGARFAQSAAFGGPQAAGVAEETATTVPSAIVTGAMRTRLAACTLAAAALMAAPQAAAQPEMPGPLAVTTWTPTTADAPPVPLTPGGVFIPKTGGPYPVVALVHGAGENGGLHTVMATTLASRGLVVLAPTFPDELLNPTTADGDNVNSLLDWAATKSGQASNPLTGMVADGPRGVLGHSNGGVVFYAAAHSSLIRSIVSLDGVAFLTQSPGFNGPSLHLLSAHHDCNGGSSVGYMGAPPPKMLATVTNGDHCDVDNPSDPFCPTVCGGSAWNAATSMVFHRYAVAWTACILAHDTSVAPWVGGTEMASDIDAGLLSGFDEVDLAGVNCVDGGAWEGGTVTGSDAGNATDGGIEHDASSSGGGNDATTGSGSGGSSSGSSGGASSGSGGSSSGGADAGDGGSGGAKSSVTGGCACNTATGAPSRGHVAWWLLGGLFLARRRGRKTPRG